MGNAQLTYTIGTIELSANGEIGKSHNEIINDSLAPILDGNFFDTKIEAKYTPWQLGIYIGRMDGDATIAVNKLLKWNKN
ncbi:MAG: hypothetical protein IPI65_15580 [Bacteroidetes bacterium]|nr:hypothetical protein [Bacteroidota bacterium]